MTEKEKMVAGMLYSAADKELIRELYMKYPVTRMDGTY